MAGTFPCPHCGATYPVKPVLINRPVRCTGCKNVFMLREGGYADKVEPEQPAAPPPSAAAKPAATSDASARAAAARSASAPPPAAPAKPSAAERAAAARTKTAAPPAAGGKPAAPAKPSAAERAAAARTKTAAPPDDDAFSDADARSGSGVSERTKTETGRVRTSRHSAKQEELRRTMAATLSDAASKALKSESVKRQEAEQKRSQKKEGAVGELGPAVLTGYGDAEARNNRVWGLGAVVVLVAVAVLGWMIASTGAERAALKAFTDPDPDWRPPSRIQEQQQRAWLADRAMPIILNVDEAEIAGSRTIPLAPLADVAQGALKDHVLLAGPGLYVPAAQRDAANRILAELPEGVTPLQGLNQQGIPAKPAAALPDALAKAGMSPADAALVAHIIDTQTDFRGGNWIRDRVLAGQVPQAVEVAYFHGLDGRRLKLVGQNKYGSDDGVRYRGRLMRFVGWSGPAGNKADIGTWHILDMQVANRDGTFPDGRGW